MVFIEMSNFLSQFITKIWLSEEFYLPQIIVIIVLVETILRSIHYPMYITRNALGSFSEYRIYFVLSAILNIILDFLLVKPLGILGLYIATIICRGITYCVDIFTVYHLYLKKKMRSYFKMLLKWILFLAVIFLVAKITTNYINGYGVIVFLIKIIIVLLEYAIGFWVLFRKSEEYIYFKNLLIKIVKKK